MNRQRIGRRMLSKSLAVILAASSFAALTLSASPSKESPILSSSVGGSALLPLDQAALRSTVESLAKDLLVPGAVVMMSTPNGDFNTLYGTAKIRGSTPVDYAQHIRIGSNTKTWIGTVILQQVQEGLLRLDDPVSKFRRDVKNGDNITIEQLLNMRSGLSNYSETIELNQALDNWPTKVWKPNELVKMGLARDVYFAPGAGFHYSNTNTILLGLIAENLDKKPLAKVLHDRLFAPLGMKDTVFPEITSNVLPQPSSRGYMYGNNVLTMGSPPALPATMQAAARAGKLQPVDQTDVNPSWGWAAGAGISTARDLTTWVKALVCGKVLNPEMQQKRLASTFPTNPNMPDSAQYGLAIAKFGQLYGHTGELPGFNSFMGHDPVNKVTLVVWTNLAPAVDGRDPATTIARALIGQIYAPPK